MGKILSRLICRGDRVVETYKEPKARPATPTRRVVEPLVYSSENK